MNHPTPEDWTSYLYDELPSGRRAELDRHAADCAGCRTQLVAWRGTLGALDTWQVPAMKSRPGARRIPPVARWAAAAAILIGVGFGLARLTVASPDTASLEARLRDQLREEFAQFARSQDSQNAAYRDALVKVLGTIEAERRADYARLRRDVETVAVLAEDGITTTQDQIARIASVTPQK